MEKDGKKKKIKFGKLAVCERLGLPESKIYYGSLKDLKDKKVKAPFSFIVPGKLHFVEEEFLKGFK